MYFFFTKLVLSTSKMAIKTEGTYSFEIIYKGSEFLDDEFPKSKDYYKETEEKIEKNLNETIKRRM